MSDREAPQEQRVGFCAICGEPNRHPMFGALCWEHEAVTETFNKTHWARVEVMTRAEADVYLRRRADALRVKRGDKWWEAS